MYTELWNALMILHYVYVINVVVQLTFDPEKIELSSLIFPQFS